MEVDGGLNLPGTDDIAEGLENVQDGTKTLLEAYRTFRVKVGRGRVGAAVHSHAERCGLLPPNQFGARPGRTTTYAALLLTQYIFDAGRQRGVATACYLDVKQAFPTV